jgi:hypothetical protein
VELGEDRWQSHSGGFGAGLMSGDSDLVQRKEMELVRSDRCSLYFEARTDQQGLLILTKGFMGQEPRITP